jgi:hypothetical protein
MERITTIMEDAEQIRIERERGANTNVPVLDLITAPVRAMANAASNATSSALSIFDDAPELHDDDEKDGGVSIPIVTPVVDLLATGFKEVYNLAATGLDALPSVTQPSDDEVQKLYVEYARNNPTVTFVDGRRKTDASAGMNLYAPGPRSKSRYTSDSRLYYGGPKYSESDLSSTDTAGTDAEAAEAKRLRQAQRLESQKKAEEAKRMAEATKEQINKAEFVASLQKTPLPITNSDGMVIHDDGLSLDPNAQPIIGSAGDIFDQTWQLFYGPPSNNNNNNNNTPPQVTTTVAALAQTPQYQAWARETAQKARMKLALHTVGARRSYWAHFGRN